MTDKLLPCPFCGGEPKLRTHRSGEDSMEAYVECPSCEVRTTYYEDAYAPVADAVGAWNRRIPPPQSNVAVKPLRWKGPDSSGEYHSLDGLWGYIIRDGNGNGFWLTEVGGYFPTADAAMVAAQADYEPRILSALLPPGGETDRAKLRDIVARNPDDFAEPYDQPGGETATPDTPAPVSREVG